MFPGDDAMPPEMAFGLWANAGDVDKGVLKQMVFPFSLGDIVQAVKVTERLAVTWIDGFYCEG